MKLKYIIGMSFLVPAFILILANVFASSLSGANLDAINMVCSIIIFVVLVDVLFIALKRLKTAGAKF